MAQYSAVYGTARYGMSRYGVLLNELEGEVWIKKKVIQTISGSVFIKGKNEESISGSVYIFGSGEHISGSIYICNPELPLMIDLDLEPPQLLSVSIM